MVKTVKQMRAELDRLTKIWNKKERAADVVLRKRHAETNRKHEKTLKNIRDTYNPIMAKLRNDLKKAKR